MALLQFQNVSFAYEGSYDDVFTDVSFQVDTGWRLGLIARNGRGKTTLLRILAGELTAHGKMTMPLRPVLFPFMIEDVQQTASDILLQLAQDGPPWRVMAEANQLALDPDVLARPFSTLSRGEQTKVQLAALFAREDTFPLIDEPTNHLDLRGREKVADYLSHKPGFLLVSHDRSFLNRCITHTLSLNRSSVMVQRGNYDTWERELERKNQAEAAQNEHLKKEITRLKASARKQADFSNKAEKGKFHVPESDVAAVDRGYMGARAAALMKRSLAAQAKIERDIAARRNLLKDVEQVGTLKLHPLAHPKERIVEVRNARIQYDIRTVCENITFSVNRGECVALTGPNGCGKSSILKAICGQSDALQGELHMPGSLRISYVPQSTEHLQGTLDSFIAETSADETLFKAILRNMDFGRQQFDKNITQYSEGQKKKLLIARSLCDSAHLYVWDEPLNSIDVFSRVQVETLIQTYKPAMLLVEHDRAFLDRVCSNVIRLG